MIPYITAQSDYVVGPNGEQLRNLESQVEKNKQDISAIIEGNIVLGELGIKVVGQLADSDQLPDPSTYTGDYGDAYLIGPSAPYNYYIFTRPFEGQTKPQWFDLGQFPVEGPRGKQGEKGDTGEQGPPGEGLLSGVVSTTGLPSSAKRGQVFLDVSTGDLYRYTALGALDYWIKAGNIKGPAGPIGPKGDKGDKGDKGNKGDTGLPGPTGYAVTYAARVNTVNDLPDPYSVPRNTGYLVGTSVDAQPYMIIEDAASRLVWTKVSFTGASSVVTDNGEYVADLDISKYPTIRDMTDYGLEITSNINQTKMNNPVSDAIGLVRYPGNKYEMPIIIPYGYECEDAGHYIVQRNANGRIQVPNTIGDGTQALNFYTAKIALGVNYISNFTSGTQSRNYVVGGQTTFGWGPGETGDGINGIVNNYLISTNKAIIDTNGHLRILNCTSKPQTVSITNTLLYRGSKPLNDVYVATDKASAYFSGDDTTKRIATLVIIVEPKSSISLDSRITNKNGVDYAQHFIY